MLEQPDCRISYGPAATNALQVTPAIQNTEYTLGETSASGVLQRGKDCDTEDVNFQV